MSVSNAHTFSDSAALGYTSAPTSQCYEKVGWLRRDRREGIAGQLSRIVAAALFSRIWVPDGNTGGANVSALKRMPIPEDLKSFLEGIERPS